MEADYARTTLMLVVPADIQWVLTFWSSAKFNTDRFISLGGDFRGTTLVGLFNLLPNALVDVIKSNLTSGGFELGFRKRNTGVAAIPILLEPAIHQQLSGSDFLIALEKHSGLTAQVPTTNIYSLTDEVGAIPWLYHAETVM